MLAAVLTVGTVEAVLTVETAWLPLALVLSVAPMLALLWRRTHPLVMTAIPFAVLALVSISTLLGVSDSVSLYSSLFVFLLPYAVFRWGSGREAVAALAVIVVAHAVMESVDYTGMTDVVIGAILYLFAAALGASVRYRTSSQLREIEKIQLVERELLARELHDTVAHYVTAITVQAEAGLARAETGQDGAVETLEAIKLAASHALTEMRALVGMLRQHAEPELAPQPGLADIERLARTSSGHLSVDFEMADDLGPVIAPVGAAIYRIAQESITNAVRHSRQATRINVLVAGDDQHVNVVVCDNGVLSRRGQRSTGYGLIGMTERVALIGGTLAAGPNPDRGWTVSATLPRTWNER